VRLVRLLVASLVVTSCGAEVPPAATVTIPTASPASSAAVIEPVPPLAPPTPRKPNPGDADGSGDSTPGVASGDSVGVPECDEYMNKYERCIRKVGGPAAAAAESAFKAQRDGFARAASTPEAKVALKGTCKLMLDSLATNPLCK
jgi:hypothetical protein